MPEPVDRRRRNRTFHVTDEQGVLYNDMRDGATVAVLMDIREELQRLNSLLHCSNFIGIPRTLKTISRKIPVRKPKR